MSLSRVLVLIGAAGLMGGGQEGIPLVCFVESVCSACVWMQICGGNCAAADNASHSFPRAEYHLLDLFTY